MKRLLLFGCLFLLVLPVFGQQLPLFTQYREYHGLINPASLNVDIFARSSSSPDKLTRFGGGHRTQWIANEAFNVRTSVLNLEHFYNLGNVSLQGGFNFLHDQIDVTTLDGFYGRGAVYVGDTRNNFWGGLGFNTGYLTHSIDLTELKAYYGGDPLLNYARLSASSIDFGVGGFGIYQWGNYDNAILLGFSVPQILESAVSFDDDTEFDYRRSRHYYTQLTYFTSTGSGDGWGYLEFSLWGKYVEGLQPNIDFNVKYQISSPAWIGAGFSTNGSVHLEVGGNIPWGNTNTYDESENIVRVGYGFDYPLINTAYSSHFGISHEINLSFLIY